MVTEAAPRLRRDGEMHTRHGKVSLCGSRMSAIKRRLPDARFRAPELHQKRHPGRRLSRDQPATCTGLWLPGPSRAARRLRSQARVNKLTRPAALCWKLAAPDLAPIPAHKLALSLAPHPAPRSPRVLAPSNWPLARALLGAVYAPISSLPGPLSCEARISQVVGEIPETQKCIAGRFFKALRAAFRNKKGSGLVNNLNSDVVPKLLPGLPTISPQDLPVGARREAPGCVAKAGLELVWRG